MQTNSARPSPVKSVNAGDSLPTAAQARCLRHPLSPDGPAERAGLKQGDVLVSIKGENLAGDGSARESVYRIMDEVEDGEELAVAVNNDVELYDLEVDPHEMRNLANDRRANGDLLLAMNDKLNRLIDDEVGKDDGSHLPKMEGVNWAFERFDP